MTNRLKKINRYKRDDRIYLKEPIHKYYIDGELAKTYKGVTKLVESQFEPFDAMKAIESMKKSGKINTGVYADKTDDQILEYWENLRTDAAKLGSAFHLCIEKFFNLENIDSIRSGKENFDMVDICKKVGVSSKDLGYAEFITFLLWYRESEIRKIYIPYRTEWNIFDEDLKFSGTIDMVFVSQMSYKKHKLKGSKLKVILYDWKCSKDITMTNNFKTSTNPKLNYLHDCKFIRYSLQLSIYKFILERNYNVKVKSMSLLHVIPREHMHIDQNMNRNQNVLSNINPIPVVYQKTAMEVLIEDRMKELISESNV